MKAGLLVCFLVIVPIAQAQGQTPGVAFSIEPSPLKVSLQRGIAKSHTLEIKPRIGRIKLNSSTLEQASTVTIQTDEILSNPDREISPHGTLFDLKFLAGNNVRSGEYSGKLRFEYTEGGTPRDLSVPVVLKVKDRPWLALLVLGLGLILSIGLNSYERRGKPRDELLSRMSNLRSKLRSDLDRGLPIATRFASACDASMAESDAALSAQNWAEARVAMDTAESVWLKWQKWREDWKALARYVSEIDKELSTHSAPVYVAAVRVALEDALRSVPKLASPEELRTKATTLSRQVALLTRLERKVEEVEQVWQNLPNEAAEAWRARVLDLRRGLQELTPEEESATRDYENHLDAALAELEKNLPSGTRAPFVISFGSNASALAASAPGTSSFPDTVAAKGLVGPRTRLQIFQAAAYFVALAMLFALGFQELYVEKEAFGASWVLDYFGLFAWGFGAEVTRASIMGLAGRFNLGGL